jgi:hypothetical protein
MMKKHSSLLLLLLLRKRLDPCSFEADGCGFLTIWRRTEMRGG